MKYTGFLICLLMCMQGIAQTVEHYYDYNWKSCDPLVARFYSKAVKTDSGWFRHDYFLGNKQLQMEALYEDSACDIQNGRAIFFHANGQVSGIGRAIHNKPEGLRLAFYSNGIMSDSANYHDGVVTGYELKWYPNGYTSDSIAHVNDSMDVHASWFDNGQPAAAGILLNGQLHGKWKYFHKNGNTAAIEMYNKGHLLSKKHYDENGALQADTSTDRPAAFKGGLDGWRRYLEKNLYWPTDYRFENGNMAVVVIELTISEDGKVESVEVKTPFHPSFDRIALRTVQTSPNWQPALQHNRYIKYHFTQAVTFSQPD